MIRDTFDRLKSRGEMAFMPYLMAGYPSLERSMEHLRCMACSGADIIELGIPFSDPVADGSTIQAASQKALERGVTLSAVLEALQSVQVDVPILLMSYVNPLLALGRDRLMEQLPKSGVHGLIIPDVPHEESQPWRMATSSAGLSLIPLIAPTTSENRIGCIADSTDGFLYYVSVTGTTGVRDDLPEDLPNAVARVRKCTNKPVAVGFGVSSPEHVRQLAGCADGVVVGSRIVQAIGRDEDLKSLVRSFKDATRSGTCS